MHRVVHRLVLASICAATLAVPARAQERASIVGLVQDASGAVMPGVTVEASSPALIEQVRTAVSDGNGRYSIIDLRPGTYTVTFTLTGFKAVKREGIVLEGAFSAQVNASLSVGAMEETVTVSGQSPVVDTQSTQNQAVLNRQVLDVLPAARTMQGGAALVPGVQFYSQGFVSTMSIHGSATADQHIFFDGMNIGQNLTGTGSQGNGVTVNELAQAELVYDAGSQSAENPLGGVEGRSIDQGGMFSFVQFVLPCHQPHVRRVAQYMSDLLARPFASTRGEFASLVQSPGDCVGSDPIAGVEAKDLLDDRCLECVGDELFRLGFALVAEWDRPSGPVARLCSASHSRANAIDDHRTLKLRKGAEHLKKHAARWASGVERFGR